MTAAECIDRSDYSRFKGSVPLITTSRYHPFIKDGEIYCTGTFRDNGLEYGFFRTNLDGRILLGLPHSVKYQINLRNNIWNLWKRLDNFFNEIIETAEFADTPTWKPDSPASSLQNPSASAAPPSSVHKRFPTRF